MFNESGIPTNFFGNTTWGVHVRKGFTSAIDYGTYINITYLGEAVQPATVIIPALPHYSPSIKGYSFNLSRAAEEFHQVPGLWDTGFTIQLLYNIGSLDRSAPLKQMAAAINSLNPKFHVTAVGLDWASYLLASSNKQLPFFRVGWLADYPDPHNFAYPYYYSSGNFAARAHYSNPVMDALIDQGIRQSDYQERELTYASIQQLAIDDCPCVPLASATGRHFEWTWVCGWYYNPIYPGVYAANLWKWYYTPHAQLDTVTNATANLLPYDVNYDGKINMYDIGAAAICFGAAYGPPISPRWNFRCDFNNDRKIDMKDISGVAKNFGKTSSVWTPSS
jgi:peptide/nickel transport system substrate-binding protein